MPRPTAPEPADPIARFHEALARAAAASPADATAAALATASAAGRPAARMVLVKGADARGFVFFTNLGSAKARDLAENPRAALCFFWPATGEQVRVEGEVGDLPAAEADAYFATRARESQVGAWASRQSEPLATREDLDARVRAIEDRFRGGDVPRPAFWGGYVLRPVRIEFWKSGDGRLHHRVLYEREGGGWRASLLQP